MYPSDSKTKSLQRALVPVLVLVAVALYAPYTTTYSRQDVVQLAAIAAAVLVVLRLSAVIVRRYGTPVQDVRRYPCGASTTTASWEWAGITHTPTPPRRGCPSHGARCPSAAQNPG